MYQVFLRYHSSVRYFSHLTVGLHTIYLLFFLEVTFQTGYSSYLALSLVKKDVICKICCYWEQSEHLRWKKNEAISNNYILIALFLYLLFHFPVSSRFYFIEHSNHDLHSQLHILGIKQFNSHPQWWFSCVFPQCLMMFSGCFFNASVVMQNTLLTKAITRDQRAKTWLLCMHISISIFRGISQQKICGISRRG